MIIRNLLIRFAALEQARDANLVWQWAQDAAAALKVLENSRKPREPIFTDDLGPCYKDELDADALRDGKIQRQRRSPDEKGFNSVDAPVR